MHVYAYVHMGPSIHYVQGGQKAHSEEIYTTAKNTIAANMHIRQTQYYYAYTEQQE